MTKVATIGVRVDNLKARIDGHMGQLATARAEESRLRAELVFNKKLQEDIRESIARDLIDSGEFECISVNWGKLKQLFGVGL